MTWIVLCAPGAAVFFIRDVLLLGTSSARALAFYALGATAGFAVLGLLSETVSRDQAAGWLRDPKLWIPAVAVHAVYGLATLLANRRRRLPPWMLLVLPSPMYLFSAGGLTWLVMQQVSGLDGWIAGSVLGAAWSLAAVLLSRLTARLSLDPPEFAAAANLSALVLIPLQQRETEAASQQAPVDWMTSLMPLAAVASLVALSFSFHRIRSSRRAARS